MHRTASKSLSGLVFAGIIMTATAAATAAWADFSGGLKAFGAGDFPAARAQWETADGANKAMAQYRLGLMLVHGTGVAVEPDTGLAWLRKAAAGGLILAQLDLAEMLFTGRDLTRDYGEALKWSQAAAKARGAREAPGTSGAGRALARYYLGRHYDRGLGVALDYHAALEHFQFAAEHGIPQAQRRLGQYMAAGIALSKDPDGAFDWLEKAAAGGDAQAQYAMARNYHFGRGVDKDLDKAKAFYGQAARAGFSKAQHDLAMFHIQGLTGEVDLKEGQYWLRRAAATGIAQSQFQLGKLELTELARPLLLYDAFDWIGKSWRQNFKASHELVASLAKDLPERLGKSKLRDKIDGDATIFCLQAFASAAWGSIDHNCGQVARFDQVVAQYVMGRVNEYGLGRTKNLGRAYRWYRRAAMAGLPRAQNAAGRLLMRGKGVPKNPARGAEWVRRAAEQGYPPAQFNLGFMHQQGFGVGKHAVAAANWYRRAAERGHARAQFNLAARIMNGDGMPHDPVQAYKWLLLAELRQGVDKNEGAAVARQSRRAQRLFAAAMTPAQLDKARQQALAFRPK